MAESAVQQVVDQMQPTLSRGLVALCEARPAEPVTWLASWLLANKPPPPARPPPVIASLVAAPPELGDNVPKRVLALFSALDTDHDGVLSKAELVAGIDEEFAEFSAATRQLVPALFDTHVDTVAGMDVQLFTSTYASVVFDIFDANHDGYLQLEEAHRALAWVQARSSAEPMAFAFPPEAHTAEGIRLSPEWVRSPSRRPPSASPRAKRSPSPLVDSALSSCVPCCCASLCNIITARGLTRSSGRSSSCWTDDDAHVVAIHKSARIYAKVASPQVYYFPKKSHRAACFCTHT